MTKPTKVRTKELKIVAYIILITASLLYGGNVVAARYLTADFPPGALAAFRGLLGMLILLPLAWRSLRQSPKPSLQDLSRFALLGFLGITVAYLTFLWAMQYSTATNAAIIIATFPAITNALLAVGWGIKPSGLRVLGIGISFLGLIVVFAQGSFMRLLALNLSPSDLILLGNVLSVALFAILGQNVMVKFTPLVTSVYSLIFGTILLLPYGIWEILTKSWHLSLTNWLVLLYMGCIVTGIAILLNFEGIKRIGSGKAAIFSNLAPVFSILLAFLFLGEHVVLYHWVGFTFVLVGIVFSIWPLPFQTRYNKNQCTKEESNHHN
ncbi:MAG: DMT family transporter [Desulfitobacteriaceae bacterium]